MTSIELSSGTIDYTDTGGDGDGPVLVLLDQPARLAAIIREFTSAR